MIPEDRVVALAPGDFLTGLRADLQRVQTDPDFVQELTSERQGNPITLGPPVISAEELAEKQVTNASNAAATWLKNVKRPRREPIKAALAAAEKRRNKVLESLESHKWEKAMGKVDENAMYQVIDAIGAEGYRKGVTARKAKVLKVAQELVPMVTALKARIEQMPDATDSDREARLLAARRGMIEIGKMRRGM